MNMHDLIFSLVLGLVGGGLFLIGVCLGLDCERILKRRADLRKQELVRADGKLRNELMFTREIKREKEMGV